MKKFPNLLAPRSPPTGSVAPSISSNVLEKKARRGGRRFLCPINLHVNGGPNLSGGTARLVTRIIEQYRRNLLADLRYPLVAICFRLRMNEFHGDARDLAKRYGSAMRYGRRWRKRGRYKVSQLQMGALWGSTGHRRRHQQQLRTLRSSGNFLTFPFHIEKLTRRGHAEARNKHLFKRSRQVTAINTCGSLILSSVAPVFR